MPQLRRSAASRRSTIAGPGFLNITLATPRSASSAGTILAAGAEYGRTDGWPASAINLEFVSANPTGPIHIGGTRWAAVGDAHRPAARGERRQGHARVLLQRPRRADRPVRPVAARRARKGEPAPEDGYAGAYIDEIAARVLAPSPGRADAARAEAQEVFRARRRRADVRADQAVACTTSASTSTSTSTSASLHDIGRGRARHRPAARAQGHIYEADGAVWLRTTDFGDDKDRVVIKSDGDPAYFSGDLAYYLDKRERGFDRCIYHARRRPPRLRRPAAWRCAPLRRHPRREPRDPHRPAGQPGQGRRAGADEQARRHRHHARRPRRGGRRRRRALLAGPLERSTPARHRPRPAARADQRQPGLLRAVRARPASRRCCATPPSSASQRGDGVDAALLTHERESDLLRRSGSSRASWRAPPSCASRTGSRATSRSWPARYHRFYDACRVLPEGDEPATDLTARAAAARARPPASCSPTASACSASARRSGCEPGLARPCASGRAPRGSDRRRARASAASRVGDLAAEYGTPAARPRRGRLPRRAAASCRDGLRLRRDVYYAGKAFLCTAVARWVAEEGLGARRLHRRRAGRRRAAGFPAERLTFHGNNKSVAELRRAVDAGRRPDRRRLDRGDRAAGRRRRRGRRAPARLHPRDAGRRGAHPRVRRDRPGGPEVRLLPRRRARPRRPSRRCSTSPSLRAGRRCTATSARRSSTPQGFALAAHRMVGCSPRSATRTASSFPSSTSAAGSASPTPTTTTRSPIAEIADADARASSRRSARPRASRCRTWLVEPGRAIAGPTTVTLYEVGTVKELPGLRTYVSVDGGMSDNIRTALYDARYTAALASRAASAPSRAPSRSSASTARAATSWCAT